MNKTYVGTGNLSTGRNISQMMESIASRLAKNGYILKNGGNKGLETAFITGCDKENGSKKIYSIFKNYDDDPSKIYNVNNWNEATEIAKDAHDGWGLLSKINKYNSIRYSYIVLGDELKSPVDFVITYTKGSNSTDQCIRLAKKFGIKVYNLGNEFEYNKEKLKKFESALASELNLA